MLRKQTKRIRRHNRVRAKIQGTAKTPRLCVFRSSQHIYAQLIDDDKARVLTQAKDFQVKLIGKKKIKGKIELAKGVGKLIAEQAKEKKISRVVFDRAGYKYHGRVKALAESAREAGLKF